MHAGSGGTAPTEQVRDRPDLDDREQHRVVQARRLDVQGSPRNATSRRRAAPARTALDLKEELTLTGATTSGTQLATVDQNNGSGANIVSLTQRSAESVSSTGVSIGTWSQSATQDFTIDQDANTGTNSVDVSQAVAQTQTAPNATTGSQSQSSTQEAGIDQFSHGVSTLKIKQSESQSQTAKAGGGSTQTQSGRRAAARRRPTTPPTRRPSSRSRYQAQRPGDTQTQQRASSTRRRAISPAPRRQAGRVKTTNTFSGSRVAEQQCCRTARARRAAPAPTDERPTFQWSGPDGTIADRQPVPSPCAGRRRHERDRCRSVRATPSRCRKVDDARNDAHGRRSPVVHGRQTRGILPTRNVAFDDPTYSHGTFALTAGATRIGIVVSNSPFGHGGAYLQRRSDDDGALQRRQVATFTSPTFTSEADCLAFVYLT